MDSIYMQKALDLAAKAAAAGEIPVGALIVASDPQAPNFGEIIVESANLKEQNFDPLGHAEVKVIRAAAEKLGRWRLSGFTLYVTLEPCLMCAGAIIHSRVDRVVYATPDPKAGAVESLYQVLADTRLNHAPVVLGGVLGEEASKQLKNFFRELREKKKTAVFQDSPDQSGQN